MSGKNIKGKAACITFFHKCLVDLLFINAWYSKHSVKFL